MGDIFEFTEFTAINKQERFNYLIPIDSLSLTFFGRQKNTSTYTTLFANTHILNAATHIANFISDYLFATSFFQPIRNYNNTQTLKFYSWLNENLYHNIVTSLAYTACDPELQNLNLGSIKETTLYAPITLKNLSIVTQQDQTKTLYQNYAESALVVALNSYV